MFMASPVFEPTKSSLRGFSGHLAQAQAELSRLSEQLPALEDRAKRTVVRAPMAGVVKMTLPLKNVVLSRV